MEVGKYLEVQKKAVVLLTVVLPTVALLRVILQTVILLIPRVQEVTHIHLREKLQYIITIIRENGVTHGNIQDIVKERVELVMKSFIMLKRLSSHNRN